jgi:hypothetical protein
MSGQSRDPAPEALDSPELDEPGVELELAADDPSDALPDDFDSAEPEDPLPADPEDPREAPPLAPPRSFLAQPVPL